jgi:hypothetical protein
MLTLRAGIHIVFDAFVFTRKHASWVQGGQQTLLYGDPGVSPGSGVGCARRVRNDDFSSTTYGDWTLRKERSPPLRRQLYLRR